MVRSYRGDESNLALVAELKAVFVNRILLSPCDEEEHVAFHSGAEGRNATISGISRNRAKEWLRTFRVK